MDVTIPISGTILSAAAVLVGKRLYTIGSEKIKKWDAHVASDETTHAVIKTKMEAQEEWLKNIDGKMDRLIEKLIP